jgi:aspartyl-tRNA(Asn)/glutamyl-tRNA(Gln) amidotransferase subunit A
LFHSVEEISRMFQTHQISPRELVATLFSRIKRVDPALRAFYELAEDSALLAARRSEDRWMSGSPLSALDGVAVSIKDHIDVAGMHSPRGRALAGIRAATADSPATARLREAGTIIVGKTSMPELPVIPETHSAAWGATRNPLEPSRSSGGSSGGAATAAASGMCTVALGSDGGGSIRLPAAFTGLAGLKPTLGRVPYFPGQTDRTVAGPIGRSIRDLAHAMNVIARPDGRDWMELPPDPVDYVSALVEPPSPIRLAYSPDFGFAQVESEVAAKVEDAVKRMAKAGAAVTTVSRVCDDAFDIYMTQATLRMHSASKDPGGARAVDSVLDYARALTPAKVQYMIDERNRLGGDFLALFRDHHFLVSPACPIPAPKVGEFYPDRDTLSANNRNLISLACPVNLVHLPALTLPCGTTSTGLPVGLQLVGPKFSDAALLRIGAWCEALLRS